MSRALRWPLVPALVLTSAGAFGLWQWLGRPVALPDVPGGRLQCLSYTPYTPGSTGINGPSPASAERIAEDLRRLAPLTDCVRIYSATGNGRKILAAARTLGLHVMTGAWIGGDRERNDLEIREALAAARDFPGTVTALVIGNEVLLRRELPPEELAALLRQVRTESPVPVAYADVAHFIQHNPVVAAAANFTMIHILPYWDDPRPQDPALMERQVERTLADVRAALPGRDIMIGETGYPSAGRQRGPARPSLVNEARFVRTFAARAPALGVRYNLIEAIDQPWKRRPEGTVGGYWGLLDEERNPKFPLSGPVSAWPSWRNCAAITAMLAALALLPAARRGLPLQGWLLLGGFAFVFAVSLVLQIDFAQTTTQSAAGWVGAAGAAVLSLAGLGLIMPVARGEPLPAPLPLRGLTSVRTLLHSTAAQVTAISMGTILPAAWISLQLAFAPRYEDVPIAQFLVPALALAIRFVAQARRDAMPAAGERREEAMLALILAGCGIGQLEWANAETAGWALVCALLALPLLPALVRELRRLRGNLVEPHETQ